MSEKGFTPKQRLFVKEYLVDKNATKAAIRAGYSIKTARSAGSRLLLTNVGISTAIEKGLAEQLEKADVYAINILAELKRIAYGGGSDRLHAIELLGKFLGIFNNRPNSEIREMSALELLSPAQRSFRSS